MKVTLKLFAAVRDIVGATTRELDLEAGATPARVWTKLVDEYPALSPHRIPMVAVNEEYAEPDRRLEEGDELAFIPPVSGG